MSYFYVHVYSVWRTPIRVRASSPGPAIRKVDDLMGPDPVSVLAKGSEYAGEIMNYRVDELKNHSGSVLTSTEYDWNGRGVGCAVTVGALMSELEAARTILMSVVERGDVGLPIGLCTSLTNTLTRIGPLLESTKQGSNGSGRRSRRSAALKAR